MKSRAKPLHVEPYTFPGVPDAPLFFPEKFTQALNGLDPMHGVQLSWQLKKKVSLRFVATTGDAIE